MALAACLELAGLKLGPGCAFITTEPCPNGTFDTCETISCSITLRPVRYYISLGINVMVTCILHVDRILVHPKAEWNICYFEKQQIYPNTNYFSLSTFLPQILKTNHCRGEGANKIQSRRGTNHNRLLKLPHSIVTK